jgi:proteasome alpha subunit
MMTPFDWQEGVAHRAEFIENRLLQGAPILAVSIDAGVVIFTYHKHARKIFEIYDQLVLAGIGQQSDLESLRTASIDFAHQEGFNRSEKDVTLRRVVSSMSTPIKRAFADFQSPPFVVRCLFAEVSTSTEEDSFAILDYEGDFIIRKDYAYVAGSTEHEEQIKSGLIQIKNFGMQLLVRKSLRIITQKQFWSPAKTVKGEYKCLAQTILLYSFST